MEGGTTRFETVLSRGNTSDVYAIGLDAVVKVPRPGVPDHWIEIEARHAAAVHQAGLPTPMVLDVMDVAGRPSIVFERVNGPSMLERLAASPDKCAALASDMAAIQREFHASAAPAELPDLLSRVVGKIATTEHVGSDDRAAAECVARELPSGSSICHGDFHPGNVLLGERGPMVIDWFDAAAGPPVADIVRSSLLVRPLLSIASPPPHLPGVTVAALELFHRTYIGCMAEDLHSDIDAALSWEAVLAVSRLGEPLGVEVDDLVAVWKGRSDRSPTRVTPLARLLLTAEGSEE